MEYDNNIIISIIKEEDPYRYDIKINKAFMVTLELYKKYHLIFPNNIEIGDIVVHFFSNSEGVIKKISKNKYLLFSRKKKLNKLL
jgi:hypothetical protein